MKRGDTTGPLASVTNKELQSELSAADTLFEQQKWDEAVAAYRAIAAKMPGVAVVIDPQIAAAYLNKKDYNAATAIYNDMLKADPANERAALGISSIAAERGDAQAAVDALMRVAGASNTSRDVFYRLADLKLGAGDVESATMWYEKAAAADPFWGKPVYKLGVVALNKGDQSSASTLMNRVITIDPESAEAGLARSALEQIKR